MNNPFYYTPSARCEEAVSSLLEIIRLHPEWNEEVRGGKTFGVLITESETLFAYSGQMLGRYDIEEFVPVIPKVDTTIEELGEEFFGDEEFNEEELSEFDEISSDDL